MDDIAGWDFFDNDNDPADTSSYFAAENHGSGRATEAVERGNDGQGSIGVCPKCQYVPMRVWDTFVSDQNNFFLAVTYAADNGVKVILGADGGLYHSEFAEKGSRYAYEKGVAQLYSGDDLNTGNHNYPAAYNHAMLVQGVVGGRRGAGGGAARSRRGRPGGHPRSADRRCSTGSGVGTTVPVSTFFRGANTTQFGGKSSISMHGPTGSTNTGKAAGAAALIMSAALESGITLSPDELRSLMEGTAEDVLIGDTLGAGIPDPAQEGFDTHFGYGRVDVGRAAAEAEAGRIPPAGHDRLARVVPAAAGRRRTVEGPRAGRATTPSPGSSSMASAWRRPSWTQVRTGSSGGPAVTDFGSLPMDADPGGAGGAGHAARSRRSRRPRAGPCRHRPLRGPVLGPPGGDQAGRAGHGPRRAPQGADRAGGPHAAGRVPQAHRRGRRVAAALRRPERRQRAGAGPAHPGRHACTPTAPTARSCPGWPVRTQTQSSAANHTSARRCWAS